MKTQKYIAYYRVSTEDQGTSGLGLEAQKHIVNSFINSTGSALIAEYQDVQTGKSFSREGFTKAVEHCKSTGALLAVKESSRIARLSLGEAYKLLGGMKYVDCSSPEDSQVVKDIKMSLAGEEVRKISKNTADALASIKRKLERGETHISKSGNVVTSLGNPKNLTDNARIRSIEVRKKKALEDPNNKRAYSLIKALKGKGESFYSITQELNKGGFKTSRGNSFSQVQTKKIFELYS